MRVFLALEDPNVRQRVALMLGAAGHEVVEISDSREMLLRLIAVRDLTRERRPGLVVTNVRIYREVALPRLLALLGVTGWSIPVLLVGGDRAAAYHRLDRVVRRLGSDFSLTELRRALWELGVVPEEPDHLQPARNKRAD